MVSGSDQAPLRRGSRSSCTVETPAICILWARSAGDSGCRDQEQTPTHGSRLIIKGSPLLEVSSGGRQSYGRAVLIASPFARPQRPRVAMRKQKLQNVSRTGDAVMFGNTLLVSHFRCIVVSLASLWLFLWEAVRAVQGKVPSQGLADRSSGGKPWARTHPKPGSLHGEIFSRLQQHFPPPRRWRCRAGLRCCRNGTAMDAACSMVRVVRRLLVRRK